MFCPNCGKELPEEASFCPYCMEKFIEEDKKISTIKSKFPKKVLIGVVAGICVLVVLIVAIVIMGANRDINTDGINGVEDTNASDSKDNVVEEYSFVEKTDSVDGGRRFNTTLDQFITCYNEYQTEEHGEYGLCINRSDFEILNSNFQLTEYRYIHFSGLTGIAIEVESATDKIVGIQYALTNVTKESVAYCNRVLSWGTNGVLSTEEMVENIAILMNGSDERVVFDENHGLTFWNKGIMYYYVEQSGVALIGLLPMSKEYYIDVVCGNSQIESNASTNKTEITDENNMEEGTDSQEHSVSQNQETTSVESEAKDTSNEKETEKETSNTINQTNNKKEEGKVSESKETESEEVESEIIESETEECLKISEFNEFDKIMSGEEFYEEYQVSINGKKFDMKVQWSKSDLNSGIISNQNVIYSDKNIVVTETTYTEYYKGEYSCCDIFIYGLKEDYSTGQSYNEYWVMSVSFTSAANEVYDYDTAKNSEMMTFVKKVAEKMKKYLI